MTPQRRVRLERLSALAVVALGALLVGVWHPGERGGFWQGIEGRLLDARFAVRGPVPAPPQVAILAFDDASIAQLAAFPPSRAVLGAVVADAWSSGAQALALDLLLVDARADDPALAAALARGPAVIGVAEAAAGAPSPPVHQRAGLSVVTGPMPGSPLPALGPAPALQMAASLGHVTVEHAPDGALRRMRPVLALSTADGLAHFPGLAVSAVAAAAAGAVAASAPAAPLATPPAAAGAARYLLNANGTGGRLEVGGRSLPLDLRGSVPLDFYGPAGSIPSFSAATVTQADLRGKIVFLGATATGFGDRHATPFDATLPGVELHATFAANLLTGRHLRRDAVAWSASVLLAVGVAVAGFMAAGLSRQPVALAATGLVAAAAVAVLQAAFVAGWWLDASTVLLALALGALAGAALQRFTQRRRATNLARYQSPALVESLATSAAPLQNRAPQPAAVLFVDVADFTPHAESWGPQRTHAFLALFTGLVEQAADECGGLIADFAGDGALVVFGVPEPSTDDVERALRFIEQLYRLVGARPDWPGLGLRVSGHAGPVQLGVLGGERHRRVSVSGDVVNTASRLLTFARSSKASLALSGAVVTASPAARHWAEAAGLIQLGPQQLRGRATAEEVWVGEPPGQVSAPGGLQG